MPYIIDLNKEYSNLLTTRVKPYGWIYDDKGGVEIEYGTYYISERDPEESMCMRVKGTEHVWAWFMTNFYQLSKGKYVDFFTKQLEEFRLDFLLWIHTPEYDGCPWVREYYEMFKGKFYDFSPEEEKEFEQSKKEWKEDQDRIDRTVEKFRKERMSNKQNKFQDY